MLDDRELKVYLEERALIDLPELDGAGGVVDLVSLLTDEAAGAAQRGGIHALVTSQRLFILVVLLVVLLVVAVAVLLILFVAGHAELV